MRHIPRAVGVWPPRFGARGRPVNARRLLTALLACSLGSAGCLRFGYDELVAHDAEAAPPSSGTGADAWIDGGADASPSAASFDAGATLDASSAGDSGTAAAGASGGGGGGAGGGTGDASVGGDAQVAQCMGSSTPQVRRIDIVDSQVVSGPHVDFPVLVSLAADWLRSAESGGDVADPQGSDLRFAEDPAGTSLLDAEVERYDPQNGALLSWVRVPSLTAASAFYLLYGDCPSLPTQSAAAVWQHYAGVWHLQDNRDAAGKNSDWVEEMGSVASAPAQIGEGRMFNSAAGALNAGSSDAIDDIFADGGFVSAWIDPSAASSGPAARIASKVLPFSLNADGWALLLDPNPSGSLVFQHSFGGTSGYWTTLPGSILLGSWHLVAVQYLNTSTTETPQFYIDGQPAQLDSYTVTPTNTADSDADSSLYIGCLGDTSRPFDGILDEVRLARQPHAAGWFATEYNNQRDPAAFYTVTPP